jgi:acylphosphatase
LGVNGWVRNRRDGTVEAMVCGSPDAVNELIEWAHQGPDLAQVETVRVSDAAESFAEFSIADTL